MLNNFLQLRVTTAAGEQYLVHKGPEFGKSSQTVVVDAGHMSSNWKVCVYKLFVSLQLAYLKAFKPRSCLFFCQLILKL